MRNNNSLDYVFDYYVNSDVHKDKEKLSYEQFWFAFSKWPFAQITADILTQYYDHLYTIVKVEDLKKGIILKYI